MWLLDKMLRRLLTKGELIVVDHDGKEYRYGSPEPGFQPVRVRLTDRGAAMSIARDPRIGAGEAYMDGRLVVEQGDIRDLILLIRYNAPFEKKGALKPKGPVRKTISTLAGRLDQINWKSRSRPNASKSKNRSRPIYEEINDEDRR